ncbi:hypothetical protein [Clostridium sp. SM-530-WT-3G]|uniref:hypothetical protein n=1 Tax=Clostridium sp. SM-530-WT-3G TaxID=2725303 RepID=UPI00145F405C|nr:hypothetical protein [Clostridium sp. SM-530-WT-3G]NME83726.1 hypothetical protein [Clostridium sp. SM-530-WT-3G]
MFYEGGVSYKEKLLKPKEVIYTKLLKRYNLIKEETVFIDDTEENVLKAKY